MKLLAKRRKKGLLLTYLISTFLFMFVVSNVSVEALHTSQVSSVTSNSTSSPELWVNITITPSPVSANPDQTFTVNIDIVNATDLWGWDIKLKWKLGLLNCTNVQEGPFLEGPGDPTFFSSSIKNRDGELSAGDLLLGGTAKSGSGTLANATFLVTDTGESTLDLFSTKLVDQSLTEISHSDIDGHFYTTFPKAEPLYDAPYYGNFYSPNPTQAGHPIVGETLTFNGSGCYDPDDLFDSTPGGIVNYRWDFGDGNITIMSTPVITHIYRSEGVYSLNLTITDDEGETDWETQDIEIKRHDIAIVNVTLSSTEVQTGDNVFINVTVSNEGSSSISFNVTTYYIGIDVGPMNTTTRKSLSMGQNATLTLQWNTAGVPLATYTAFARAYLVDTNYVDISLSDLEEDKSDNTMFGEEIAVVGAAVHDTAITQVTVEPTELRIDTTSRIRVAVKNEGNTAETNIKVNVTATNAAGQVVYHSQSQVDLTPGSSRTLSLTWFTGNETAQEGQYNITAIALPISGETDVSDNSYPVVTVVMRMIPVANFTYSPSEPLVGETLTLDASTSYAPGTPASGEPAGTIVEYEWSFGDGNITTVSSSVVTHIYGASGDYLVRVTVTDNDGLSSLYTRDITVFSNDIAITGITFSPSSVVAGELVSINVTVENLGDFTIDLIPIRAYYSTILIDSEVITGLEQGAQTTIQFDWDTSGVEDGTYYVIASTSTIEGEIDTENNRRIGDIITIEKVTLKMTASTAIANIGTTITLEGSIETSKGPITQEEVTIWHMTSGGNWSVLAKVTTDQNGQYSTEWTPDEAGSYALKATWPTETSHVESSVYVVDVQTTQMSDIFLYATVGLGAATILLAAFIIYSRIKKPAQKTESNSTEA